MNKLLQRTFQIHKNIFNPIFFRPIKHFQLLIKKEKYIPPGPAPNDFIFEKAQTDRSMAIMNEIFARQGR